MNQPEIFDPDILDRDVRALQVRALQVKALQEWLRTAWRQLGDSSLTALTRRELRDQMKQCSADLKAHLQNLDVHHQPAQRDSDRPRARPELRILA